jgi:hypothetical protein
VEAHLDATRERFDIVQVVVETAKVSELVETLEEEDSTDENPAVFRSALYNKGRNVRE